MHVSTDVRPSATPKSPAAEPRVSPVELAKQYGRAKSRQDVEAALDCCTEDFVLDTVPYRTLATGRTEVAWDLRVFFELFPDYEFACAGSAEGEGSVVLWGYARMTWSGRLPQAFGIPLPRGFRLPRRRIEVPAVAVLDVRDGLLSKERFYFDMKDFCRQLGLPSTIVVALLRRMERRRHAAVHGESAIREENSAIVRAPIEVVYDGAFADVQQLLRANPPSPLPHATRIELVGSDTLATGAIRRVHLKSGHVTDERMECNRPHHIGYEIENGWGFPIDPFVARTYGSHELEALDGGATRVTWRGYVVPRSTWALPVVEVMRAVILGPMQRRFLKSITTMFAG